MATSTAVNMASLDGFAVLLRRHGDTVTIELCNGVEMKDLRLKAAKHIFAQCKKAGSGEIYAVMDTSIVHLSEIDDDGRY